MATAARRQRATVGTLILLGAAALALPTPARPVRACVRPVLAVGHAATIGFIGDSITARAWDGRRTVPDLATAALGPRYHALDLAQSGTTTADWLPQARTGFLPAAIRAMRAAQVRVVQLMLGTNDSRDDYDVPPGVYGHHLQLIAQTLSGSGFAVVLAVPPYATPGGLGVISAASDARLRAYATVVHTLAAACGAGILAGDTTSYRYFQQHPHALRDGVHPAPRGARALGQLWAGALRPLLAPPDHAAWAR